MSAVLVGVGGWSNRRKTGKGHPLRHIVSNPEGSGKKEKNGADSELGMLTNAVLEKAKPVMGSHTGRIGDRRIFCGIVWIEKTKKRNIT